MIRPIVASVFAAIALTACDLPPSRRSTEESPQATSMSIPIKVVKPEGAGPFPAVVILHDCSGLGPRSSGSPGRWAAELVKQGYVVAMPDSFSTRGHASGVCTDPSPSREEVNPFRRVRDAYEALAYVRALSYVDRLHVGVMGGSHGGTTTLATIVDSAADSESKRVGFTAAVALYPACGVGNARWTTGYRTRVPALILAGELDDWTPADSCIRLSEAAQRSGSPVSITVYPGAHHSFDSANPVRFVATRINMNAPGGRGATTGGNAEAWADSIRRVTAFFAAHLRGQRDLS